MSSDRCDVIYPTTQLYKDTATCYNDKLTGLIYEGERAVDWKQAKMMEGSSPPKRRGSWKGTGRRMIGQRAGHTIHLETEEVIRIKKIIIKKVIH